MSHVFLGSLMPPLALSPRSPPISSTSIRAMPLSAPVGVLSSAVTYTPGGLVMPMPSGPGSAPLLPTGWGPGVPSGSGGPSLPTPTGAPPRSALVPDLSGGGVTMGEGSIPWFPPSPDVPGLPGLCPDGSTPVAGACPGASACVGCSESKDGVPIPVSKLSNPTHNLLAFSGAALVVIGALWWFAGRRKR